MTSSSFVLHVLSSNQSQPTQRGTPQGHSRRLHLVQRGGPFPLFCPPRGLRCSAIFVDFWCRKLRKFRIWLGRACADRYYTNTYYIYIYHIYVRVYIYMYQLTTLSNLIGCLVMFGGFPLFVFFWNSLTTNGFSGWNMSTTGSPCWTFCSMNSDGRWSCLRLG